MTIKFHCEHCNKEIKAKDANGGRKAKCPACKNSIYIPEKLSEEEVLEEIKLAPVDEEEERKKRELLNQTLMLQQDLLDQKENSGGSSETNDTPVDRSQGDSLSKEELRNLIVKYIRYSADGRLHEAEGVVQQIKTNAAEGLEILDQIAVSDMPDEKLADIPPGVLAGYIRNLRGNIK